jgi:hypothetical protein
MPTFINFLNNIHMGKKGGAQLILGISENVQDDSIKEVKKQVKRFSSLFSKKAKGYTKKRSSSKKLRKTKRRRL